jgi:hypothetical protein
MTDVQFDQLHVTINVIGIAVLFALGYIAGHMQ